MKYLLFILLMIVGLCAAEEWSREKERDRICSQPLESGRCLGYFPSYGYIAAVGWQKCVQFIYGGCQGNENRFATKADCEEYCEPPQWVTKKPDTK